MKKKTKEGERKYHGTVDKLYSEQQILGGTKTIYAMVNKTRLAGIVQPGHMAGR